MPVPDPIPYASARVDSDRAGQPARRPKPLLAGGILAFAALARVTAAYLLLTQARDVVVVPPPTFNAFASVTEREQAYNAYVAVATARTPAKTAHVIALFTAAAVCLLAATAVLRKAVAKLMSA